MHGSSATFETKPSYCRVARQWHDLVSNDALWLFGPVICLDFQETEGLLT